MTIRYSKTLIRHISNENQVKFKYRFKVGKYHFLIDNLSNFNRIRAPVWSGEIRFAKDVEISVSKKSAAALADRLAALSQPRPSSRSSRGQQILFLRHFEKHVRSHSKYIRKYTV